MAVANPGQLFGFLGWATCAYSFMEAAAALHPLAAAILSLRPSPGVLGDHHGFHTHACDGCPINAEAWKHVMGGSWEDFPYVHLNSNGVPLTFVREHFCWWTAGMALDNIMGFLASELVYFANGFVVPRHAERLNIKNGSLLWIVAVRVWDIGGGLSMARVLVADADWETLVRDAHQWEPPDDEDNAAINCACIPWGHPHLIGGGVPFAGRSRPLVELVRHRQWETLPATSCASNHGMWTIRGGGLPPVPRFDVPRTQLRCLFLLQPQRRKPGGPGGCADGSIGRAVLPGV